jgi:AraC-like DNA-binding protein
VQVFLPLSASIRLRASRRTPWRTYEGAVAGADVAHESDTPLELIASICWMDADTLEARALAPAAAGRRIVPIAPECLRTVVPDLGACWDGRRAAGLLDALIDRLAPRAPLAAPVDARIVRAQEILAAAPLRRVAIGDVATAVSLSPSRLAHLLRSHLGLPVRRYLLWMRLRDAIQEIARGASTTAAAHAAGFADASHLDRTFRRMLGFTPSAARAVSQFVQATPAAPV